MDLVIGKGIVTVGSILSSINVISSNLFSVVQSIKMSKHIHIKEVNNIIIKSDVVATIKLLQSIISEIPDHYGKSPTVIMALNNVQEIIQEIEIELKDITEKINFNHSLYIMANWRSYDFKDVLDNIEKKFSILDRRKENLYKILEIFKNLKN
jgi:hypothetical protein